MRVKALFGLPCLQGGKERNRCDVQGSQTLNYLDKLLQVLPFPSDYRPSQPVMSKIHSTDYPTGETKQRRKQPKVKTLEIHISPKPVRTRDTRVASAPQTAPPAATPGITASSDNLTVSP